MPAFTIEHIVRGTRGALLGGDLGIAVGGVSIDSRGLGIGPGERLVVVAGAANDQPLVAADQQTVVISIKGSDLADFLADRITHDETRRRIEVKVF